MLGRALRLIAASTALTFLSLSGASAGLLGWGGYGYGGGYGFGGGCCGVAPAPVNWGCASTCAPLPTIAYASSGCCAPVRWGCCNSYGYGYGAGYGYGGGYGYQQPVYVVNQGPSYSLPATGYTYPVATYDEPSAYPYVTSTYPGGYRPRVSYPSYRPYYRPHVAHYGYRHHYYGPRRGYFRPYELPPK